MNTTLEDLLNTARIYCAFADRETGRDRGSLEKAAQYAAVAQAHAATAQAMILAQTITPLHDGKEHAIQTFDNSRGQQ